MEAISQHRTLLLLGAAGALTWLYLSRRKRALRRQVGQVSQLILYPIKSCKGIPLQEAECREYGLKDGQLRDRHWLVVKEDKIHVTARQEPRMVLITATCDTGNLTLAAPEMDDLKIPLTLPKTNAVFTCKVHGHEVPGRDCGDEASNWINGFLKRSQKYRLVYFEDTMKPRDPEKEFPLYTESGKVAYPDIAPILIISEASVDDVNAKLEKKVSSRNFRPNIVVSGCDAFAEDTWNEIQIGNQVTLKRVMPCPRCILSTVDPDTGIIDMKEPLETLRSYRLSESMHHEIFKSSPLFGQYLTPVKLGSVKVGDPVYQITY